MEWYNGWSAKERCASIPIQKKAVADGAIPAPAICSICGSDRSVGFHDEDYTRPLAAFHVCRSCHLTLHKRFSQPEPWLALVKRHATGSGWFERLSLDPGSRTRPYAETYPEVLTQASSPGS